jgi:hypothetical protein
MITDLTKYKRIFAFGCSFTSYIYPTWADIIYKSMSPDVEFYNFGKSGGGNVFIANRITEANRKYKFTETDLVVVMWSTHARIDFFKTEGRWKTPGNIYSQGMLSEHSVRELEDLNWFLLRDLSMIDLTTSYLNNLPCGSIKLMSVPADYESRYKNDVLLDKNLTTSIIETYSDILKEYPNPSLYEFMNYKWSASIKYKHHQHPEQDVFIDYHPTPVDYANYLIRCNVPITEEAIIYARESLDKMLVEGITHRDIVTMFPDCDKRVSDAFKQLW